MSLAIVLSALKIIGIGILAILAVILGILLFLLILFTILVFSPIHYKLSLVYDNEHFKFDLKFNYLLRLITGEASNEKKLFYRLKLSFFTVFSSLKKPKKKKGKKAKKAKEEKKVLSEGKTLLNNKEKEKQVEEIKPKEEKKRNGDNEPKEDIKIDVEKNSSQKKRCEGAPKKAVIEETEEDFFDKVEVFYEKVIGFWEKIYNKIKGFLEAFESFGKKKDAVLDFIHSDGTLEALKLIASQSCRLIRAILPKKIEGWIRFGTGDAYTEGQYLTYLCLFYGLYADKLEIEPEWEEKVFMADVTLSGKIRLFTIIRICIKVYFNEDFKKLRDNIDFVKTRLEHS